MNDNDGGLKRSPEPVENASTVEHKKQKINNEQQQQQQPEEVSILPTTLVLDKAQEETINDLVKNSNAAVSLLQQNAVTTNTSKKPETKDPNQTIESEIPSADSIKAVTALPGTENEKSEDVSASITSEQLLFALTSVPSSEKEAEGQQGKSTNEREEQTAVDANKNKSTTDNSAAVKVTNVPPVPQTKVPSPPIVPAPALPAPTLPMPTGLGITPKITPSLPEVSVTPAITVVQSDPAVPESIVAPISSASTDSETLPIAVTTTTSTPTTTAPVLSSALPQTSLANTANSSSIPHVQKTNINNNNTITNTTTATSSPSLSTSAAAAATSLAFSSLPDISAALRRLSNANPSVIEQLSASASSPRLSSSINAHLNDRKGSSIDVSPSEILGNALAAVAANAAAARSSPNNNVASPKQQQQQQQQQTPSSSSTTTTNNNTNNNNNNNNAQATAAAIGNLAAFTANISSLLNSGGFHRNSFSQEDTQKLAAAVAVARNPQQRRKSSMQVVGNAFSNMIDQAILMGRNKSFSEAANRPVPPTSNGNNHLPSTTTAPLPPPPPPVVPKPKLIIKNDQVWKSVEGMEEKSLGFQLYSTQLLLPNLEDHVNGLMEIRVPARFLTFENVKVKKRALWGTDIYTDDSDIVAMAIHSGKYQPHFTEPTIEPTDPFALAVAGKQKESIEAAKRLALSGKKYTQHDQHLIPDHDLKVTVRVLPTLQHYASSIRHKLKSREWGKHDGMSLFVNKVEKVKRGEARLKGRSSLKSNMFAYESYRKQTLGLHQDKKPSATTKIISSPPIQKGRIKKTRKVMRMFQIRSELKNKNNK